MEKSLDIDVLLFLDSYRTMSGRSISGMPGSEDHATQPPPRGGVGVMFDPDKRDDKIYNKKKNYNITRAESNGKHQAKGET
jgi:hypothetical protein